MKKLVMLCLLLGGCGVGASYYVTGEVVGTGVDVESQVINCIQNTCGGLSYFVGFKPADDASVATEDAATGWCYCATPAFQKRESFGRHRF